MNSYDVVVIGAGPGGYVAAIRASQNGLKTAIIDKKWLGGVCLNIGCIPSKSLLKNADIAYTLRKRAVEFGVSFDNLVLDYSAAVKRSRNVSMRLTKGVGFLMKKNNIDVYLGNAELTASKQVSVTMNDGSSEVLEGKDIIIATGAHPFIPPVWEPDGEKVISYSEAILQEKLPASVVVIGAGAIGVEFSTVWNSYGTEVHLVEMLPSILPLEDEEVSKELSKSFRKAGIKVLAGHKVESVNKIPSGVSVKVSGEDGEKVIEAEQALVAIGFRPNTAEIGLDKAGIELDEKGFIKVDEKQATNVPGIWAIGDVTGKLLLAHVASSQGSLCANAISSKETQPIDYQMVPSATYCHPQVASFGMTESEAVAAGHDVKVGKFPFLANGKALGLGESAGFAKLVGDENTGKLLGASLIGPEVSELLPELILAQKMGLSVEAVAESIHAHPTLSEVVMEAAEGFIGNAVHL